MLFERFLLFWSKVLRMLAEQRCACRDTHVRKYYGLHILYEHT